MIRRQSRSRGENYAPALFPFLAVLVCTMGALVLILVMVVSQASALAKATTTADEQLQVASDEVHLVSAEMLAQRAKQQEEIEKQRAELTAVEDHIHRLVEELKDLQDKAKAIEQQGLESNETVDSQQEKIAELEEKLREEKEKLDALSEDKDRTSPAFAIIPYKGTNGTTRRPIYLECTDKGLIIQPEGVLISIDDLRPPHGPGNPLDTSLRLIRATFQRLDPQASQTVSPYPLLLVRPNGIKSYVLARAAMSGWDDQFGYELLDQEMPLAFPPTIPGLANELRNNLEIARQRQVALIAAMPRRFGEMDDWEEEFDRVGNGESVDGDLGSASGMSSGSGSYASGANGKFASNPGRDWSEIDESELSEASIQSWRNLAQKSGPGNSLGSSYGSTSASGSDNNSRVGTFGSGVQEGAFGSGSPSPVPFGSGVASSESMNHATNSVNRSYPQASNDNSMPGSPGEESDWSDPTGGQAAMGSSGPGQSAGLNGEGPASGSSSSQPGSMDSSNTAQTASGASSGLGTPQLSSNPQYDPTNRGAMSTQREQLGNNANPTSDSVRSKRTSAGGSSPMPKTKKRSSQTISSMQGRTWAVGRRVTNSTAITRPIHVVASQDRWLVMQEDSIDRIERIIPLNAGPSVAGNNLAETVRQRVDSWGGAVSGGYWAPKLVIEVEPGAENSALRLQKMLEGSDMEVELTTLRSSR